MLVLLPNPGSALTARFTGSYNVVRKLNDTDYVVCTPERRQKTHICHVNMLKAYHDRGKDDCDKQVIDNAAVFVTSEVLSVEKDVAKADEDGLSLSSSTV